MHSRAKSEYPPPKANTTPPLARPFPRISTQRACPKDPVFPDACFSLLASVGVLCWSYMLCVRLLCVCRGTKIRKSESMIQYHLARCPLYGVFESHQYANAQALKDDIKSIGEFSHLTLPAPTPHPLTHTTPRIVSLPPSFHDAWLDTILIPCVVCAPQRSGRGNAGTKDCARVTALSTVGPSTRAHGSGRHVLEEVCDLFRKVM